MIEFLENLDQQLFLYLNGMHAPWMDTVMYWISNRFFWLPLYVLLIVFIILKEKRLAWVSLVFIALLVLVADQTSVHWFKEVIQRFRPCRPESPIHEMVHIVAGHCGGKYGFISSHATNAFAMAVFLFGILKSHYRYFGWFIFLWAAVVSYSRIYLGVHYVGDVLGGALWGSLLGAGFYF